MVKKKEEKETPIEEEKEKSPDYEKRIAEFEKKLGDLSSTIESQKEFIDGASVVINTLAYTPELREAFQAQLKKQYGMVGEGQEPGQQQKQEPEKNKAPASSQTSDEITKRVDDVSSSQREAVVADFEKNYGIDNLKDEEKKETRRKLETYLNEFGWSVKSMPLASLKSNLEKAYIGTHAEKLKEEGKLEGFVEARTNEAGVMGTISGTAPQTFGQQPDLTEGQKKWAEKLGVDITEAKKAYMARDEEEKRVPESEKKAKD